MGWRKDKPNLLMLLSFSFNRFTNFKIRIPKISPLLQSNVTPL